MPCDGILASLLVGFFIRTNFSLLGYSQACSALASHLYLKQLKSAGLIRKCYLTRTESTNVAKKTWRMADLEVGTIPVYFPRTDKFAPENRGIINGLAYYPVVY